MTFVDDAKWQKHHHNHRGSATLPDNKSTMMPPQLTTKMAECLLRVEPDSVANHV